MAPPTTISAAMGPIVSRVSTPTGSKNVQYVREQVRFYVLFVRFVNAPVVLDLEQNRNAPPCWHLLALNPIAKVP